MFLFTLLKAYIDAAVEIHSLACANASTNITGLFELSPDLFELSRFVRSARIGLPWYVVPIWTFSKLELLPAINSIHSHTFENKSFLNP